MRERAGGTHDGIGRPLERETDVDQSGYDLHCVVMLGMVEEVSLAALVCRMPVEDVELRCCSGVLT